MSTPTNHPMDGPNAADITTTLHHQPCSPPSCQLRHPNIKAYTAKIHLTNLNPNPHPIGHIDLYLFHKSKMPTLSPNRMWEECHSFSPHHPGTKLDKIENYLANESFSTEGHEKIERAEVVLFIDQVWLEARWRGKGRGLVAVSEAVKALQVPRKGVVMLQAGDAGGGRIGDVQDAGERLTRHWRRLGFEAWSESDPSWLLVSLEDVYWA
ncbi:hypothetical protein M409DRAFT_26793 [Zasmidium cellare ATCC 36951]|uniref:N-acetyltransferase domain-containing protein n=1 Tax=Zasmidium cellare ATCC 36951 TaxID=1080233 RepID=A0A6A6C9K1_ZASCE|nr:uncharacterized protein M409DRAFT_26793 [Zasmidium cellare ATCC 36951]KAF2162940.1 hypothetical protein M409DRAFT_26793 [Zasmidium cellare ATCC 36951]